MSAPTLTTLPPYKVGKTHCNPRVRTFSTAIYAEAGTVLVAEVTVSFEGSRFDTKRTADEARLESMARAAFIVRACNAHAGLVEALLKADAMLTAIRTVQGSGVTLPDVQTVIRAILQSAKE